MLRAASPSGRQVQLLQHHREIPREPGGLCMVEHQAVGGEVELDGHGADATAHSIGGGADATSPSVCVAPTLQRTPSAGAPTLHRTPSAWRRRYIAPRRRGADATSALRRRGWPVNAWSAPRHCHPRSQPWHQSVCIAGRR
ncbi:MAG: hypothetical protein IKO65_09180 [Victivallales bacterium]|nr:hypothetical protein [Victivallales bacterium]